LWYNQPSRVSPGKVLPLGSDFPVEGVNPLLGFYAAVSRLAVDGRSPHGDGGWYVYYSFSSLIVISSISRFSAERLTRAQALKGMTLDPAYASFAETELGSLTVGKRADFVLLDRNIMEVELGDILRAQVVATIIDGKVAYGTLGTRKTK
jgi:predicted amidohydrolase YtcJ